MEDFDYKEAFNRVMAMLDGGGAYYWEHMPKEMQDRYYLDNGIEIIEDDDLNDDPEDD